MKSNATAFGAGALFAIGLALSGMTKPSKVTGFLDVAGAWDASLLFVMIGAVAVYFVAHRFILRRSSPFFEDRFHLATRKDLDAPLVAGAAIFGVGWGLGGFCPGPGLVTAGSGSLPAVVFVVGATIGIVVQHALARRLARR